MKIKDLSTSERPRERLYALGAQALSSAELIAILIGSGTRSQSAVDIGHLLLQNSLPALADMSARDICKIPGIGPGKACSIVAAMELGRRALSEARISVQSRKVSDPRDVARLMEGRLAGLKHEECWLVLLDRKGQVLSPDGIVQISVGIEGATLFSPKTAVARAIQRGASSIILVHNHPSGDPSPSPADVKMTEQLSTAAAACDVNLLDHVVFADGRCFSFSDEEVFCVSLPSPCHPTSR